MTSRDRYNAWLLGQTGGIESRLDVWQAAEHDMLERAIAKFDGADTAEYSCKEIQIILKELLNEPTR